MKAMTLPSDDALLNPPVALVAPGSGLFESNPLTMAICHNDHQ
jgi:hypothetical protein